MKNILDISELEELQKYLLRFSDKESMREQLFSDFLKYARYRNAEEWNNAVRICEALAIIGWGNHEPVEAIRGIYFNGNPNTYFINRDGKPRFLDAIWSKRKDGLAIDFSRSFFHESTDSHAIDIHEPCSQAVQPQDLQLCSQRNWISKNPIRIVRGLANCYDTSKPLIESMESCLIPELNRLMRPELYGSSIDTITLNLSFSFYDNYHCKTNYIIADESLKLKQKDFYPKLLELYSEKEIQDNGYYLRNRFSFKPFRKESGTTRVDIVLEKEFSQLSDLRQKQLLSEYLLHAVEHVAQRLDKKIAYDFPLMISDFKLILNSWLQSHNG